MDVYVHRHRAERRMAVFLLLLFTCLSIWAYRVDQTGLWCFVALTGTLLTGFFTWQGMVVDTVSEAGVTRKTLFCRRHISWDQVHRAAAVHLNLGGYPQWYLSVTRLSENGKPQGFLLPYSESLRDAVVRFYGPLDVEKRD